MPLGCLFILASTLVQAGGLGEFSRPDLQHVLAGTAASVSASVTELEQQLVASATPRDVETLFHIAYLNFTAPRYDEDAVQALLAKFQAVLANRSVDPNAAFQDTLQVTLGGNHPRAQPPSVAMLDDLDPEAAHAFFRERFADAGGFTFTLVGNLDVEALEPLVRTYLGGLPTTGEGEGWWDTGVRPPSGVVGKVVREGTDPGRLEELVDVVFQELERLKEDGPRDDEVSRVREIQRRERETNLRQNAHWAGQLMAYDREGTEFAEILTYERLIEGLTCEMIREAARTWLRPDRYVRVSLVPTDEAGEGDRAR